MGEPDILFKVGAEETEFPAHSSILKKVSSFVLKVLNSGMKESSSKIIILSKIEPKVFEIIMEYIYFKKLPKLSEDSEDDSISAAVPVLAIAEAARFLQMDKLAKVYEGVYQINSRSFASAVEHVRIHKSEELIFNIFKYIASKMDDVSCAKNLPQKFIKMISQEPMEESESDNDEEKEVWRGSIYEVKSDLSDSSSEVY